MFAMRVACSGRSDRYMPSLLTVKWSVMQYPFQTKPVPLCSFNDRTINRAKITCMHKGMTTCAALTRRRLCMTPPKLLPVHRTYTSQLPSLLTNLNNRNQRPPGTSTPLSPPARRFITLQTSYRMDPQDLKHFLADSPPTTVNLIIKQHFDALVEKQQQYAHYISK